MTALMSCPPGEHTRGQHGENKLADFTLELLSPLTRSDQRRWGEVYLQGLLSTPGRKSLRRMCEHVLGAPADQSLQQFLNQSTWDWHAVRSRLADTVEPVLRPRALSVDEVVFPKNGSSSVGVDRQYAPSLGRTVNCQLSLAASLVGDELSCPVGWRLLLPPRWDDDERLRSSSRVPGHERHRPRWQEVLELFDETHRFGIGTDLPVLMDGRAYRDLPALLAGLDRRGIGYLVQALPQASVPAAPSDSDSAPVTLGHAAAACRRRMPAARRAPADRRRAEFAAVPLGDAGPGAGPRRRRTLLAQWGPGDPRLRGCWVTNLGGATLADLVSLTPLRRRARTGLNDAGRDFGLYHFEGRSYRGWHHHVTLVSASYAYAAALAPRAVPKVAAEAVA